MKHGCGKMCSAACQIESKKRRVSRNCAVCGAAFDIAQSRISRAGHGRVGRFCSRECAWAGAENTPPVERFWRYVTASDAAQCWEWQGSLSSHGYGQLGAGKRGASPLGAHRLSWEIHHGPIPDHLFVLHECDNRRCVNPSHLFLGTCRDNAIDASAKGRVRHGEGHHAAKLTREIVVLCRLHYADRTASIRELARRYGVGQQAMSDAVHGRTWATVR